MFEIPDDAWSEDFTKFLEKNADFAKIFPNKEQRETLILIVERIIKMIDFHAYNDKAPHEDMCTQLNNNTEKVDAKLRNHRHDMTKQFSAKPEF